MTIITLLFAAREAFAEWRAREQADGDLMALDDHVLADIGLHRSQIPAVIGGREGARHQHDLLSANPLGLGRQQIEIQHQLNG